MEEGKEFLSIEAGNFRFTHIWVGQSVEDARELFIERMRISQGDTVRLTNGLEVAVIKNSPISSQLLVGMPKMAEHYEYAMVVFEVPYFVVEGKAWGTKVLYEDTVRLDGCEICRRHIAEEKWEEAADLLDTLFELSVNIEEFSPYLATIYDKVGRKIND